MTMNKKNVTVHEGKKVVISNTYARNFSPFFGALICKVLTGLYILCERLVLSPLRSSLRELLPCDTSIIGNNVLCARIREGLQKNLVTPTTLALFLIVTISCIVTSPHNACAQEEANEDSKEEAKSTKAGEEEKKEVTPIFTCSSEVTYTWEPQTKSSINVQTTKNEQTKQPPKPQVDVHYTTITRIGTDENSARAAISALITKAKTDAFQACQYKHNNTSSCVANRLKEHESEYRTLDFIARRTFLDALKEDCQLISGTCIKTTTSEITCKMSDPTTTPAVIDETGLTTSQVPTAETDSQQKEKPLGFNLN